MLPRISRRSSFLWKNCFSKKGACTCIFPNHEDVDKKSKFVSSDNRDTMKKSWFVSRDKTNAVFKTSVTRILVDILQCVFRFRLKVRP
ncbi:hypothetical protein AVEN_270388-1 [Araneus ventricosus]|uniref:Uncharacterized protein n=1 Tax=Araneus ventricosus TaxID=182803 RepID=A0A4Y2RPR5_ARAVE|nr:hypothetical protein AVEN_270388-1 [Araneus ventricosus]